MRIYKSSSLVLDNQSRFDKLIINYNKITVFYDVGDNRFFKSIFGAGKNGSWDPAFLEGTGAGAGI